jgi:hypothetical protein
MTKIHWSLLKDNLDHIELWQDSPKDRANFIIVEIPINLFVLHVLDPISNIPKWNARVDNYVVSIFGFVNKYLARDGFVLLFYDDDFHVLRDIKSYLEDYNFKIHLKFDVVNGMHHTNLESLTKKVNLFSNSTKVFRVCMNSMY